MERISVFDIFKIGIGPSSSHTMGPWKAALRFISEMDSKGFLANAEMIQVEFYGSLAKTGKGHGSDIAVILGLQGEDPSIIPVENVMNYFLKVKSDSQLNLRNKQLVNFSIDDDLIFYTNQTLPFHSNGMKFRIFLNDGTSFMQTYYSVGGGFIIKEGEENKSSDIVMPYPVDKATDLKNWCETIHCSISEIVMNNERAIRSEEEIILGLLNLWNVMKSSMYKACHTQGTLPGGLNVQRRAQGIANKLLQDKIYTDPDSWIEAIKNGPADFTTTLKWLSCFALAVNEENADFGRIVTAPTNGAAGVIPAVLMYHICFSKSFKEKDIITFLLTAGEIGSLFKKGATISAAMGGCQAEIGVSSAMAAAALTECLGGNYNHVLMAAEIAMEHHLGMTCDPIGGLVQVPCIERNTMGAIKAVTAAQIALESDPDKALITLDAVIKTMKETAYDMNSKYKETADGGLAIHYPVNLVEC